MATAASKPTADGACGSSVTFKPLSREYLAALKTLNSVIFPVKYHERVYQDALACGPVSVLAFEGNTLIGAIVCRLEVMPDENAQLYIISLGVLAPYREQGVGSQLLCQSLTFCRADPAIKRALLHVHAGNEEALGFYTKRGFTVQETIHGYYKRLDPPDAVLLVKLLEEVKKDRTSGNINSNSSSSKQGS